MIGIVRRKPTFHPTAKPNASSTYRAQICGIEPGSGSLRSHKSPLARFWNGKVPQRYHRRFTNQVAISPKHIIIPKIAMPVKEYPKRTERGPARVKALPIPRNKPVPMVPPNAMNWMCLDLSLHAGISNILYQVFHWRQFHPLVTYPYSSTVAKFP